MLKRILAIAACVFVTSCGSSGTPTSPSSGTSSLSAPTNFVISAQQVTMTSNIVSLSWSGSATTYRVIGATNAGGSDLLSVDITGTTYTWTAPRTAGLLYVRVLPVSGGQVGSASTELPVFTIDMRNVIDALFFGYGPMSDANGAAPASTVAVWPDGVTINVLVTTEAGDLSVTAARSFVADYLAATSNFINVTVDTTATPYTGVALGALPANTVVIRVDKSICPQVGVIACAYYGPSPYGPGRSFVNQNAPATGATAGAAQAIAHEIGHAFGLHHLVQNSSARAEFKFLLNPVLTVDRLSDVEKTALAVARAGGIRPGMTRSQAVALGLVLP